VNARPPLIAGASLALCCLTLGLLLARPSAGQAPPAAAKPEAHYQAVPVGNYVVVVDSATGESWARLVLEPQIKDAPERAWSPLGSPAKKK
jgi:hypothetical protein